MEVSTDGTHWYQSSNNKASDKPFKLTDGRYAPADQLMVQSTGDSNTVSRGKQKV